MEAARDPGPGMICVRWRTVAKVDPDRVRGRQGLRTWARPISPDAGARLDRDGDGVACEAD